MATFHYENQLFFTGGLEQVIIQNIGQLDNGCVPSESGFPSRIPIRRKGPMRKMKSKQEMETKRMTHMVQERNRRRQVNNYLAVLRSMMPPSYSMRGDQATIVGGTINFVKELEQVVHYLEAMKFARQVPGQHFNVLPKFLTFPQYATGLVEVYGGEQKLSNVADIEVSMVENHANIKVVLKSQLNLLIRLVEGLHLIGLSVLHLTITTVNLSILYSLSVKMEKECRFLTANEIATAVHDMLRMFHGQAQNLRM